MQDDEFANPGSPWLEKGASLWTRVEGGAGKSCASCHQDVASSMRGVGARYPVYAAELGRPLNVEQRINQCRTERMGASAWQGESEPLLAMSAYVKHQSLDLAVDPRVDGPAALAASPGRFVCAGGTHGAPPREARAPRQRRATTPRLAGPRCSPTSTARRGGRWWRNTCGRGARSKCR